MLFNREARLTEGFSPASSPSDGSGGSEEAATGCDGSSVDGTPPMVLAIDPSTIEELPSRPPFTLQRDPGAVLLPSSCES